MHKFQQASIQGVPLKMLALLTTEQQECRTVFGAWSYLDGPGSTLAKLSSEKQQLVATISADTSP